MLERLLQKRLVTAIEHSTLDGHDQLYGLRLKKEAKKLELDQAFEATCIDDICRYLKLKQEVFLIINTDQVLFKELDSALDIQVALGMAFPNLSRADFYFECITGTEKTFIAICRREPIDDIIAAYQKLNVGVIGFSLGNLSITHLASMLSENQITTSNAEIHFENKTVVGIVLKTTKLKQIDSNGLVLANTATLSLAGILGAYIKQTQNTSNFENYNKQLKEQVKQQHLFNLGLKISLATIFVLLLFSFLQFSSYRSKIDSLTAELQLKNQQKTQLITLSEQVDKKEKLIKDYSLAASKSSWYLNQVGKSVPQSILLTEIDWQPLLGSIKENESIKANQNSIVIRGISSIRVDFSNWLSELEEKEWVQKVAINEYGVNKKKQTHFEVQLSYTP